MIKVARECLEAFRVCEMMKNDKVWYLYYVHVRPLHVGERRVKWSNVVLLKQIARFDPSHGSNVVSCGRRRTLIRLRARFDPSNGRTRKCPFPDFPVCRV